MPVRPELSLAVQRPKLYDPGQVLSLRDLAQQGEMRRMTMEGMEAQRADQDALKQVYGAPGALDAQGLPTAATMPKIGAIKPELVPKLAEQRFGLDKLAAETRRANSAADASQVEIGVKKEGLLNEMVRGPALAAYDEATKTMTPEAAARVGQMAYSEGMERAGKSGIFSVEERGQFPLDFDTQRVRQRLMQSKDWMAIQSGERGRTETERHNKATEAQRKADAAAAERRAKESADRETFGQPFEATGPDGKPKLVVQNKKTGAIVDANTKEPVSNIGPKPGEASQKQITGVATTKDAIKDYREALKKWSASDIANPNARARMGTVYNNMLLQAKEAYNLGVLNGPDYMILQEVITNPASLTGGITSKSALDDQAKKLDELMGRVGQRVTSVQTGQGGPLASKRIKFSDLPK